MLDPSIYSLEEDIVEYEYLRDEDLQLPKREPVQRTLTSFISRFSSKKPDFSSQLALQVIKS
jgi:hypothetical protein